MTIETERQKSTVSPIVVLYTLDLTPIDPTAGALCWTPSQVDGVDVVFQGITYAPLPIELEGIAWDGQGPAPRPKLRVGDGRTRAVTALLLQYQGLRGAIITRVETHLKYLDGQAEASNQHYPAEIFVIDRKTSHQPRRFVEWECVSALDQDGRVLPAAQVLRTCRALYRFWDGVAFDYSRVTCPYAGDDYFTELGEPTDNPALDRCSKGLTTGCELRFGAGNELPYRGFPGAGDL